MSIKIKQKDIDNSVFMNAVINIAELLGQDVEITASKSIKFKPYNVQIWLNDCDVEEKDFQTKKQALKWIKHRLSLKKYKELAYADLKKYNRSNDDFDWWFYKNINNQIEDVTDRNII